MTKKKKRKSWGTIARRKARVRALVQIGLSQKEIALRMGVRPVTVWSWVRKLGLSPHAHGKKVSRLAGREDEVRAMADRGLKRRAIASRLGVGRGCLDRMLSKLGVRTGGSRYIPGGGGSS